VTDASCSPFLPSFPCNPSHNLSPERNSVLAFSKSFSPRQGFFCWRGCLTFCCSFLALPPSPPEIRIFPFAGVPVLAFRSPADPPDHRFLQRQPSPSARWPPGMLGTPRSGFSQFLPSDIARRLIPTKPLSRTFFSTLSLVVFAPFPHLFFFF